MDKSLALFAILCILSFGSVSQWASAKSVIPFDQANDSDKPGFLDRQSRTCPCKCKRSRATVKKTCSKCNKRFLCKLKKCKTKGGKRGFRCCDSRKFQVLTKCTCSCSSKMKARQRNNLCHFGSDGANWAVVGCKKDIGEAGFSCCFLISLLCFHFTMMINYIYSREAGNWQKGAKNTTGTLRDEAASDAGTSG